MTQRLPPAPAVDYRPVVRYRSPCASPAPLLPFMRETFRSPSLKASITADDVRHLDYDQARVLSDEVADNLRTIKGLLAGLERTPSNLHKARTLNRRRSFLAQLHQTVLRHKADTRPEREAPSVSVLPDDVPDEAAFFVTAAKNMLDPATFQRLTLIAAQRRAAELARRTGLAIDADGDLDFVA